MKGGRNYYHTPGQCDIGHCLTQASAQTSGTIETWKMESEYPRAFSSQVFAPIDSKVTQYFDVRLVCGTTETGISCCLLGCNW